MENQDSTLSNEDAPGQGGGTTFLRTCFNGINTLSGVGILSVAYALSQGGWSSLALLFSVAILCWYTGLLLKRCMDTSPLIKTYPDIGQLAFGSAGRTIVSVIMYVELYLVAVEFLIMEGDNLDKLFPHTRFHLAGLEIGGKQAFVLQTALAILPTTWMTSFGMMSYVSAGGVLASVVLVVCVFWVGAVDGVGFSEKGTAVNWSGMPTAVSLFTFCFCGHTVFPTLYHSMKDRSQFQKVLLVCFVTSTITYGSVAVLGYLMYGQMLDSQVTLNLPAKKLSTNIAIYTILINPLAKYALIITPIANAIENLSPVCSTRRMSIIIRSTIVASTAVVALTVPFFGSIMAFTGAFLIVTSSMILPCLCYLKISSASGVELMGIVWIILIASFVCVIGTYTSVREIVTHL